MEYVFNERDVTLMTEYREEETMDKREAHLQSLDHEVEKAMDAMFPYGAGQTTHQRVRHWLDKIAQVAFTHGEQYALLSLLTVEDVAEQFGITPRRVRAIARNRHNRLGIGWQVPGTNQWLFRPEEVEHLAPDERYRRK